VKPSREVTIPRVRCPWCGASSYRTRTTKYLSNGDRRTYPKCNSCGSEAWRILETDDTGNFQIGLSANPKPLNATRMGGKVNL
jgi:ribosomal protein L37E